MASRFDGRIKRLEALQGDDVESILDLLNYDQGSTALRTLLMALLGGVELSDERLRQSPVNRARNEQVLASIPDGTFERLLSGFLERVARREAA